jgi:hypothetical protein
MPAISVQNDANMTRHLPLFDLIKQPALINPVKRAQERRCGSAFVRPLSLNGRSCRSVPPSVELGKGSLLVKS